jgi:hypothetical protein
MLKQKNYPKIVFDDAGVLTDLSLNLLSFGRDSSVIPLETIDFIYFGRYKPFDALFVELSVPNVVVATLTVEYWNGTAWVDVSDLVDDTKALTRGGFIQFTKPADWAESTTAPYTAYFIRISPSVNLTPALAIQGMNLVFSDDQDLNQVYPGVANYLSTAEATFILRHENARDQIVQEIRNRGLRKAPVTALKYESYEHWDFMHVEEVRLWSIYLTLENIFSGLQSKEGDMFMEKAKDYREKAEFYKAAFYLTLDADDTGLESNAESVGEIHSRRLVRG